MDMDKWIELILGIFTLAFGGGLAYFYVQIKTIKATQKKADGDAIKAHAEARKVNAEAESIEVESDLKLIDKYAELYNEVSKELKEVKQKLEDRDREREVERKEAAEWQKMIVDELKDTNYKYEKSRCDIFDCPNRRPPRKNK